MAGRKKQNFKESFACQYLQERDIRITAGGKPILKSLLKPEYRTYKLKTGFWIGDTFLESSDIQVIKNIEKVNQLGYAIVQVPKMYPTTSRSVFQYVLMRRSGSIREEMKKVPDNHWLEYNPMHEQARLCGRDAAGPMNATQWISSVKRKGSKINMRGIHIGIEQYRRYSDFLIKNAKKNLVNIPDEPVFLKIKELPIMISDNNELVCIPQTADEHTIGIFGQKRSGKSFMLHAIIDRMFWTPGWEKRFVILNDSQSECGTWCKPNNDKGQYDVMHKVNHIPLPLPCVYIYPHVKDKFQVLNDETCYEITMPYEEIIRNYRKYMELDRTSRYFEMIAEDLCKCTTTDDVAEVLDNNSDRIEKGSSNKIMAQLTAIFEDEITEANTGIPHTWDVEEGENAKYSYNPLTACMVAGIIPVFETATISSYPFFKPYFRYFVEDIFNRQIEDPFFIRRNIAVYFFIDELHTVSAVDNKGVADTILKRLVREGGPRRIGVVISDQNFSKLSFQIKSNLKYIITFSNPAEANNIASLYKLDKDTRDMIKNLKKFECLAITTDEEFVVYTRDGNSYRTKGPIKGKSLPPLGLHKKPSEDNVQR
jgi:hypothetical protein